MRTFALVIALLLPARPGAAQERGAAALGELIGGLSVTARVLVVAAHPDDEDTRLITWLRRGRHYETAYLSLTRGDGGQNLIGNELGEALGVIRTEELLAARRVDGARQYFTRAYDFGFSKSAQETFEHWPHDTILGDVVRIVRAYRPHVVIAIFSGTPADGHGHHQASGILAREAYDVSGDTTRFPTREFGPAWTVAKFYRATSYRNHQGATYRYNAGEYSQLTGRSFAEIAAESRSQHKSQGMGALERKGAIVGTARREATRVNESTPADRETSLLAGLDTTLGRLRPAMRCDVSRAALDSLPAAIAAVQRDLDLRAPDRSVAPLVAVHRHARRALHPVSAGAAPACRTTNLDAEASLGGLLARARQAIVLASGVTVDATVSRDAVALGDSAAITVAVYNRGRAPLQVLRRADGLRPPAGGDHATLLPDSALRVAERHAPRLLTAPEWLAKPRRGDLFDPGVPGMDGDDPARSVARAAGWSPAEVSTEVIVGVGGEELALSVPVVYRYADPIRGELSRPLAVVPAVSVTLGRVAELAPANAELDREFRVQLRSADTSARDVRVSLRLPRGLTADSAARTVTLPGFGAVRTATFRVRGRLPAGSHRIAAIAESRGDRFTRGYVPIEYDHIRPQKLFREAVLALEAVDVVLPPDLTVAYIRGVGDNVAPALQELGVSVTVLASEELPTTDLARYSTVVVGPRAYESSDVLVAYASRLLDYVRGGGTLVVQYGQYEMTRPGIMPYPITLARPADRVTVENGPVRVLRPDHPVLTTPNRIGDRDFAGWVQDRTLYMPRTFAPEYTPLLAMSDPGEAPTEGALLVAPYGRGTYVYTTLAFFRQIPAGVPGAVRLFANLLGARGETGPAVGREGR